MQYNAVYASVEVFHITNLNKPRQMNRYQETVLINIYLLASPGSSLHCEVLDTVINLRKNSSCMVLFHKLTLSAEAVLFRWNFPSVGGGGGGSRPSPHPPAFAPAFIPESPSGERGLILDQQLNTKPEYRLYFGVQRINKTLLVFKLYQLH